MWEIPVFGLLNMREVIETILEYAAGLLSMSTDLLTDIGDSAANILSTSSTSVFGRISLALHDTAVYLTPALQGVGYGIAIMFFLFNLLNLITSDQLTLEQFIKKFCWLFVGIAVVALAPNFFDKCVEFGDAFTTLITGQKFTVPTDATEDFTGKVYEAFCASVSGDGIPAFVGAIICFIIAAAIGLSLALASAILVALVYVVGFQRLLRLNIRGAFLPIGLALFSDEGWRGAGGRYFRSFLSVCCQGAVIAIIGKVTTGCIQIAYNFAFAKSIVNQDFLKLFVNLLSAETIVIGVAVASVAMLFESQRVIADVFGAQ